MLVRYLPLAALMLAFCSGCNTASKQPPAAEAHDDHDHDHGHEHGHDDHAHEGHDHGDHEHGEHDHPEIKTYAEAVEIIEASRDKIRDSLAAGETEKADEALHSLGHTLEHVGELSGDFADDVRSEIKKDVDELFELYGKIDEQIHGKLEVTYDAVADKIDAAVERLHSRTHDEPAKEAQPE